MGCSIGTGLQVQGEDLALAVLVLDLFVETSACLASESSLTDHLLDECRELKDRTALIFRTGMLQSFGYMDQGVETNEIRGSKSG